MKKIKYIVLMLVLIVSNALVAQSGGVGTPANVYTPNFTPPSPEAFSFTKVAEIPVNESSGNATVDIPLYTYEAGKIKVPISMSHGGGAVRVDDDNSWTGISWQLSAGGLITRTINDKPDERMGTGERLHPSGSGITQSTIYAIAISSLDSEVDIFNYNFNGHSGSFYFDTNMIARQIKYDNELKIEISADPIVSGVTTFNKRTITITTPDGTKYSFGGLLASESTKIKQGTGSFSEQGQTSFYLCKIENIVGDIVTFNYTSNGFGTLRAVGYNQELVKDVSIEGVSSCSPSIATNPSMLSPKPYYMETSGYLRLSSITSNVDASRVDFNSSSAGFDQIVGFKLDNIKIYDYKNVLYKNIKLNYVSPSVVGTSSSLPSTVSNVSYKRFFLESIEVLNGSNTSTDEIYSFEYNNFDLLPKRFSYWQDYAGYYNGASNTCYIPNIPSFISAPLLSLANRNVSNSNHAQYGSLSMVTYPTKGYIQFEYESGLSNLSSASFPLHTSSTFSYKKPGIRIKKIRRYASHFSEPMITRYYYKPAAKALSTSGADSEVQVRYPLFTGNRRIVGACEADCPSFEGFCCYPYTIEKRVIYSKAQNNIYMSDFNRNTYEYVTVSYGGDNFENGGKQSHYFVQADLPVSPISSAEGYVSESKSSNNSLKNGTLLDEILFKNGAIFNTSTNEIINGKVKETINSYLSLTEKSTQINNWYASKFCEPPLCISGNYSTYTDNYYIGQYTIFSWWHTLASTTTKEYLDNGIVETVQNYSYDGDATKLAGMPSSTTTIMGSDTIETKYHYPPFATMALQPNRATMLTKYVIGMPLATEVFKNGTKISEQRTLYNSNLFPQFIYAAKFPNNFTSIPNVGTLEKKITFNSYDAKGNVTQYTQENGIPVSVIWGFNKTKVVAKLENIAYGSIPSTLITNIENVTNATTSTETQINDALSALRTSTDAILQNTFITTINYNSLKGVSTITDPKGDAINYHYDTNNRLQFVKDKNGKILSENEYNYKP